MASESSNLGKACKADEATGPAMVDYHVSETKIRGKQKQRIQAVRRLCKEVPSSPNWRSLGKETHQPHPQSGASNASNDSDVSVPRVRAWRWS